MARVAIIIGKDFEDSEFREPLEKLREVGHFVEILGAHAHEELAGKKGIERVIVDAAVTERDPESYDAVVIPGGYSPDHLRMEPAVVRFVQRFVRTGRPIAAICHGPQLLIEADVVRGRRMTSWPSVKTDLQNAGADWVDAEVVVDAAFITSRKPEDIPAFNRAILQRLSV